MRGEHDRDQGLTMKSGWRDGDGFVIVVAKTVVPMDDDVRLIVLLELARRREGRERRIGDGKHLLSLCFAETRRI